VPLSPLKIQGKFRYSRNVLIPLKRPHQPHTSRQTRQSVSVVVLYGAVLITDPA